MEELLTIAQAMKFYPRGTHATTIFPRITRGIKTRTGVVKLEACRIGGRWITTQEAIERFRDTLMVRAGGSPPALTQSQSHARSVTHLRSIGF